MSVNDGEGMSVSTAMSGQAVAMPFDRTLLGALPSELRLMVYKTYFQASCVCIDPLKPRTTCYMPTAPPNDGSSLLRVCRRIHDEAKSDFAKSVKLKVSLRHEFMPNFTRLIGSGVRVNASNVEHVVVDHHDYHDENLAGVIQVLPNLKTLTLWGHHSPTYHIPAPGYRLDSGMIVSKATFKTTLRYLKPKHFESDGFEACLAGGAPGLHVKLLYRVVSKHGQRNRHFVLHNPINGTYLFKSFTGLDIAEYGLDEEDSADEESEDDNIKCSGFAGNIPKWRRSAGSRYMQ